MHKRSDSPAADEITATPSSESELALGLESRRRVAAPIGVAYSRMRAVRRSV